MRVGIVGAGICGISAARRLKQTGHKVVLFEKSRGVGGRVATRRSEGFVWDTGATSVAPRGKTIEQVILTELPATDLVEVTAPIWTHDALRVSAGDQRRTTRRFVYRNGLNTLPKLLAQGLEVRTRIQVGELEKSNGGYRLCFEGGGAEEFDAVILTPPIPQTSTLLWAAKESRPIGNARYRPCLSVMLGYHEELPTVGYHALINPDQQHPLTWLCLESVKSPGRAPEGGSAMVAQLSAPFSLANYERPDEWLVSTVAGFIQRLYGPKFATPAASDVMRWKYSQPEALATFENVNLPGSRLLIASDSLLGGHIEDAYEVGQMVAAML